MRVGIDGNCLKYPHTGVARYLRGTLSGLDTLRDSGLDPALIQPPRLRRSVPWVVWNMQRLSAGGFDLLHFPFYYTPLAPRCPVTVSVHDVLVIEHPEWFPRVWGTTMRRLIKWSSPRASAVVTGSATVATAIHELCRVPRERIVVIPYGVDTATFCPQREVATETLRARWNLTRPFVLQVGAFEPRRAVGLSLLASRALRREFPDLQLVLAGEVRGHDPALEKVPDYVWRLSRVTDGELAALYNAASIVLAPSLGEGFDFPFLEALACGAAVAASNIPVHIEHFDGAAEFFNSGDVDSLIAACTRVLTDTSRVAALRANGPRVAACFTWTESAARHAALWRQVVGNRG